MTFGVVADADDKDRPPMQIVISLAEAKTMLRLEGGICWENWLFLRGLDENGDPLPTKES